MVEENKIISIVDWNEHFEKSQTRKIAKHSWVAVPNKHDGLGLKKMLREENGLEIFAIWIFLIQIASKCETRGILADEKGRGYSIDDIALKVGCKTQTVECAIPFLVSINWVSIVTGSTLPADYQHATTALPPDYHGTGSTLVTTLHNTTEHNTTEQHITKQDKTEPYFPEGNSVEDEDVRAFATGYLRIPIIQTVISAIPKQRLVSPVPTARAIIAAINRTNAKTHEERKIAAVALAERFELYYASSEGQQEYFKDPDKWLNEDRHLVDPSVWDSRKKQTEATPWERIHELNEE